MRERVSKETVFKCGEEAGTAHGQRGSQRDGLKACGGVILGWAVLASPLSQGGRV